MYKGRYIYEISNTGQGVLVRKYAVYKVNKTGRIFCTSGNSRHGINPNSLNMLTDTGHGYAGKTIISDYTNLRKNVERIRDYQPLILGNIRNDVIIISGFGGLAESLLRGKQKQQFLNRFEPCKDTADGELSPDSCMPLGKCKGWRMGSVPIPELLILKESIQLKSSSGNLTKNEHKVLYYVRKILT